MLYESIANNIKNGAYESKLPYFVGQKRDYSYITDENKSVVWNRAQVDLYNSNIDKIKSEYKEDQARLYNLFKSDCISLIRSNLDPFKVSDVVLEHIFNRAYDSGHSAGFYEVLTRCNEDSEYVEYILRNLYR